MLPPHRGERRAPFIGSTAYTVNLGTGISANAIVFQSQAYTINSNTLTLAGASPTITVNASGGALPADPIMATGLVRLAEAARQLAHPEVYVLILPAMGIVAEIIANNTRKPLWGYRLMVYAACFLGFMSFLVWAHHMYLTGMGTVLNVFFQTTTMIISIPSVVVITALLLSLYGGSIRFNTPMLFALAFLPMFGIGGLTGLPLGLAASDIPLHDTYYVIGHFHYVVAPGSIFAVDVDKSHPVAKSFNAPVPGVWFENGPAFEVTDPAQATIVAKYPTSGTPLLSGWLLGPQKIAGKGALVDAAKGKGHVILFGFRPQYRGQSEATLPLVWGAIQRGDAAVRP